MAGRRERCSWCGVQLLVPPEAQTIQCSVCQAVTRTRPNDPLVQAQDSVRLATNCVKGFVNKVSSNINTMATSMNNYPMQGTYDYGQYPQRIQPPPLILPVSAHGRKRALLCGVSYYGRRYNLKGSVNDVRCMRYFLVERLGFPSESILVLTGIYKSYILLPCQSTRAKNKYESNTNSCSFPNLLPSLPNSQLRYKNMDCRTLGITRKVIRYEMIHQITY